MQSELLRWFIIIKSTYVYRDNALFKQMTINGVPGRIIYTLIIFNMNYGLVTYDTFNLHFIQGRDKRLPFAHFASILH